MQGNSQIMKAVMFEKFTEPPKLVNVPDPAPQPHGVVLKVEATGVCRSDWHGWMGHDPDIELPHVPGHELAGTVQAVGKNVLNWKIGDRVTVPFVGGCGACPECHAGHQQVCHNQFQPGFTNWGSFAEYVAIHQADLNLVAYRKAWTLRQLPALAAGLQLPSAQSLTRAKHLPDNGLPSTAAAALVCQLS